MDIRFSMTTRLAFLGALCLLALLVLAFFIGMRVERLSSAPPRSPAGVPVPPPMSTPQMPAAPQVPVWSGPPAVPSSPPTAPATPPVGAVPSPPHSPAPSSTAVPATPGAGQPVR